MVTMSLPTAQTVDDQLRQQLGDVEDPELPVPITELGMVRTVSIVEAGAGCFDAEVVLVPTFLGCPAQLFIERDVRALADRIQELRTVQVRWSPATEWSVRDITQAGRHRLAAVGVAVPDESGATRCPYCGSADVVIDSEFGASLCRRLGHCSRCGDPVELMRARSVVRGLSGPTNTRPPTTATGP